MIPAGRGSVKPHMGQRLESSFLTNGIFRVAWSVMAFKFIGGREMRTPALIGILVIATAAWGAADSHPSAGRGKELFSGTLLGTNGRSCSDCHPDGKRLERAAAYSSDELADIINQCIRGPLKGKPLAVGSADLDSLILYIRTFASRSNR